VKREIESRKDFGQSKAGQSNVSRVKSKLCLENSLQVDKEEMDYLMKALDEIETPGFDKDYWDRYRKAMDDLEKRDALDETFFL